MKIIPKRVASIFEKAGLGFGIMIARYGNVEMRMGTD
jgi:hypothetical protein